MNYKINFIFLARVSLFFSLVISFFVGSSPGGWSTWSQLVKADELQLDCTELFDSNEIKSNYLKDLTEIQTELKSQQRSGNRSIAKQLKAAINGDLKKLSTAVANSTDKHKDLLLVLAKAARALNAVLKQNPRWTENGNLFISQLLAAYSALTKHAVVYLNADSRNNLDWKRYRWILENIIKIPSSAPKWGLYRVQRAIETRYNLGEFIDCL